VPRITVLLSDKDVVVGIVGWVVVALIGSLVVAVAAAELVLRFFSDRLHPLSVWQNWEMEHKVASIDALAPAGGVSVVAVGSSDVNAAFDPALLSDLSGDGPAFNAAVNGLSMDALERWALRVIVPRLHPRVLLIGLGSHAFNRNNKIAAARFESLVTSQAWGDLVGRDGRRARMIAWAEKHLFLFRYRSHLGHRSLFQDSPTRRHTASRADGSLRALLLFRFRPYGSEERQLVTWNDVLASFEVGDPEIQALARLIEGLRAAGVVPVIVRMPYTTDWISIHPGVAADIEAYERALAKLVHDHQVTFLDAGVHFASIEGYADPVHLNGAGRARFTKMVAEFLATLPALERT
jgi:hypothetical protein